jgi:septal ring factor EnvC (AmiA/AmiB activator)
MNALLDIPTKPKAAALEPKNTRLAKLRKKLDEVESDLDDARDEVANLESIAETLSEQIELIESEPDFEEREAGDVLSRFDRLTCYSGAMWEVADRVRDGSANAHDWSRLTAYIELREREEALAR